MSADKTNENNENCPVAKQGSVGVLVNHEWDQLKEAIIGSPFARFSHTLPALTANYISPDVFESGLEFCRRHRGKTLMEVDPQAQEELTRQIDATKTILSARGVMVHQMEPFETAEDSYLADLLDGGLLMFPRDPIIVIGDLLIECANLLPFRRKERFSIRRTLESRLKNVKIISMPEPIPVWNGNDRVAPAGKQAFLEGGDVLVLGRDIYVGHSGNASTTGGIQWLKQALGPDYRVTELKLAPKFLHLDCVLSTPREGLALVCREAFVDGLPKFLSDWEIIAVSAEDATRRLGCNALILDARTVVIAEESPALGEALTKAGQTVISTPFSAVFKFGGSFRCWHHPLIRATDGL